MADVQLHLFLMTILRRSNIVIVRIVSDYTVGQTMTQDRTEPLSGAPFQHAAIFHKKNVRLDSSAEWLGFLR